MENSQSMLTLTSKFDKGVDVYDTSEKARVPSWTDRILYKANGGGGGDIALLKYDSVTSADTRCVFGSGDA